MSVPSAYVPSHDLAIAQEVSRLRHALLSCGGYRSSAEASCLRLVPSFSRRGARVDITLVLYIGLDTHECHMLLVITAVLASNSSPVNRTS